MDRPWGIRLLAATALVAAATGLGALSQGRLSAPDLVMVYLLSIVVAAWAFGRGPALLASALSVLAYDFFFVPPLHTFAVTDVRHLLTFATMFAVGQVISALMLRIREHEAEALALERKARTEEMRASLLSAVSHDLRTPLGAITGAATTLRDDGGSLDSAQRADLLEAICQEAERMERLVANLLEMTRVEAGALQVQHEWVPLEELVGSALHRLEPRLQGRSVRVIIPPGVPFLSVDPVLFEQVLFNLLDNAAVHTPAGTPIEIMALARDEALSVEVRDHGRGLPAGTEARVFEKFFRVGASGAAGAGLGLAICKGVVEAHGGRLRARNAADGSGAIFEIILPRAGVPPEIPAELETARGAP